MDRFHNEYGAINKEGNEIIDKISSSIRDIISSYRDDIEALIFMREALIFVEIDVTEAILFYSRDKYKKEFDEFKKNKEKENEQTR